MNAQELHHAALDYAAQHPGLDPADLQAHAQALLSGGHPEHHLLPSAHRLHQQATPGSADYTRAVQALTATTRASIARTSTQAAQ